MEEKHRNSIPFELVNGPFCIEKKGSTDILSIPIHTAYTHMYGVFSIFQMYHGTMRYNHNHLNMSYLIDGHLFVFFLFFYI